MINRCRRLTVTVGDKAETNSFLYITRTPVEARSIPPAYLRGRPRQEGIGEEGSPGTRQTYNGPSASEHK